MRLLLVLALSLAAFRTLDGQCVPQTGGTRCSFAGTPVFLKARTCGMYYGDTHNLMDHRRGACSGHGVLVVDPHGSANAHCCSLMQQAVLDAGATMPEQVHCCTRTVLPPVPLPNCLTPAPCDMQAGLRQWVAVAPDTMQCQNPVAGHHPMNDPTPVCAVGIPGQLTSTVPTRCCVPHQSPQERDRRLPPTEYCCTDIAGGMSAAAEFRALTDFFASLGTNLGGRIARARAEFRAAAQKADEALLAVFNDWRRKLGIGKTLITTAVLLYNALFPLGPIAMLIVSSVNWLLLSLPQLVADFTRFKDEYEASGMSLKDFFLSKFPMHTLMLGTFTLNLEKLFEVATSWMGDPAVSQTTGAVFGVVSVVIGFTRAVVLLIQEALQGTALLQQADNSWLSAANDMNEYAKVLDEYMLINVSPPDVEELVKQMAAHLRQLSRTLLPDAARQRLLLRQ